MEIIDLFPQLKLYEYNSLFNLNFIQGQGDFNELPYLGILIAPQAPKHILP